MMIDVDLLEFGYMYNYLLYFTVKHLLLECHDLAHIRDRFYRVKSVRELFASILSTTLIDFLKD
jgi:hypothetical protein